MIESRAQLIERFLRLADRYAEAPDPVTGIDLDDAIVALRRHLLTQGVDETGVPRELYDLGKLIRRLDLPAFRDLLARIRAELDALP